MEKERIQKSKDMKKAKNIRNFAFTQCYNISKNQLQNHEALLIFLNVVRLHYNHSQKNMIGMQNSTGRSQKKNLFSDEFEKTIYTAERFALQEFFSEPQNPRFIIESGFKSNAG